MIINLVLNQIYYKNLIYLCMVIRNLMLHSNNMINNLNEFLMIYFYEFMIKVFCLIIIYIQQKILMNFHKL